MNMAMYIKYGTPKDLATTNGNWGMKDVFKWIKFNLKSKTKGLVALKYAFTACTSIYVHEHEHE
jgi:hypothetical protein